MYINVYLCLFVALMWTIFTLLNVKIHGWDMLLLPYFCVDIIFVGVDGSSSNKMF